MYKFTQYIHPNESSDEIWSIARDVSIVCRRVIQICLEDPRRQPDNTTRYSETRASFRDMSTSHDQSLPGDPHAFSQAQSVFCGEQLRIFHSSEVPNERLHEKQSIVGNVEKSICRRVLVELSWIFGGSIMNLH